jgi:photosynthetic reaction center cytochrome c subunit
VIGGRRIHATALLVAAMSWTAAATEAGAQPPRRPPPLQNVKVLTTWDGTQLRDEMRRINTALGVQCDYCHVQGNFPSDEKRTKRIARRMLEMTLAVNQEQFAAHTPADGESRLGRVTCYTCHQGAAIPKSSAGAGAPR